MIHVGETQQNKEIHTLKDLKKVCEPKKSTYLC